MQDFIEQFILHFAGRISGLEEEARQQRLALSKAETEKRQLQDKYTDQEKVLKKQQPRYLCCSRCVSLLQISQPDIYITAAVLFCACVSSFNENIFRLFFSLQEMSNKEIELTYKLKVVQQELEQEEASHKATRALLADKSKIKVTIEGAKSESMKGKGAPHSQQ